MPQRVTTSTAAQRVGATIAGAARAVRLHMNVGSLSLKTQTKQEWEKSHLPTVAIVKNNMKNVSPLTKYLHIESTHERRNKHTYVTGLHSIMTNTCISSKVLQSSNLNMEPLLTVQLFSCQICLSDLLHFSSRTYL